MNRDSNLISKPETTTKEGNEAVRTPYTEAVQTSANEDGYLPNHTLLGHQKHCVRRKRRESCGWRYLDVDTCYASCATVSDTLDCTYNASVKRWGNWIWLGKKSRLHNGRLAYMSLFRVKSLDFSCALSQNVRRKTWIHCFSLKA
jgi:hypothetical protein